MKTTLLDASLIEVTDAAQAVAAHVPEQGLIFLDLDLKRMNHIDAQAEIDKLNAQKHLGHEDWTLPPVKPLFAHTEHDRYNPAVDKAALPFIKPEAYWTSTLAPSAPEGYAFFVTFLDGAAGRNYRHFVAARVLACRVGGPASPSQ